MKKTKKGSRPYFNPSLGIVLIVIGIFNLLFYALCYIGGVVASASDTTFVLAYVPIVALLTISPPATLIASGIFMVKRQKNKKIFALAIELNVAAALTYLHFSILSGTIEIIAPVPVLMACTDFSLFSGGSISTICSSVLPVSAIIKLVSFIPIFVILCKAYTCRMRPKKYSRGTAPTKKSSRSREYYDDSF